MNLQQKRHILLADNIPYDSDAQVYFDTLSSLGYPPPSQTMKGYYNTFYKNLKTGLVNGTNSLSKADRIWWRGSETREHNLVSLKNPTSTLVEEKNSIAGTWVQYRGYVPNGIDMYLDLHFIPSVDGVQYIKDNAGVSIYSRTNANNTGQDVGVFDGTNYAVMDIREAGIFYSNMNDLGLTSGSAAVADSLGLFSVLRTSSTNVRSLKRAVVVDNETIASSNLPTKTFFESARNNNGSPSLFSTRNNLVTIIHRGDINMDDLNAAVEAFALSLGANA